MIKSIVFQQGREQEAILKIIAFFDLFDFPLSNLELYYFISSLSGQEKKPSLSELINYLSELINKEKLESADGFYFLKNRSEIINIRRRRYNYSQRKIKIASRFAKIFSLFPFVRKVYLANSIGFYNLRDGSDIDFFIISSARRIFLSRLFCTGLAKLLNSRPNKNNKKDKICLSFYLSEDGPKIDNLKLSDGDPYFDFWEAGLLPLSLKKDQKKFGYLNFVYNFLEKIAAKFQFFIMPKNLSSSSAPVDESLWGNFGVIIRHDILKLYLSDRRLEIKKRYEKKLGEVL